ncbi:hypothetical protein PIB30_055047 [Stylosanthes scabra]|uniref:Uncharacterized protein n=1 Tax=Stylosanthes scabra TaxID=79078 RepID=A0ABU6VJY9_9FABA|nr:hypothetical protein [Stylosanthes scabra]
MNISRTLNKSSFRRVVGSSYGSTYSTQFVYASARSMPDLISHSSIGVDGLFSGTKEGGIRCFHASPEVWARRGDEPFGLKTPKKEKYIRREGRSQPPVEARYVPRNVQAPKSNSDKTVEIFEGMTLDELAKRTGKSVSSLQDILTNVGEKCESEFEPLSMDIVELAAMAQPANWHSDPYLKTTSTNGVRTHNIGFLSYWLDELTRSVILANPTSPVLVPDHYRTHFPEDTTLDAPTARIDSGMRGIDSMEPNRELVASGGL